MNKDQALKTAQKRVRELHKPFVIFELKTGVWTFTRLSCWEERLCKVYSKNPVEIIQVPDGPVVELTLSKGEKKNEQRSPKRTSAPSIRSGKIKGAKVPDPRHQVRDDS